MGRVSVIGGLEPPPPGTPERTDGPDHEPPREPLRDPWTPPSGPDLLAGVAVVAVLVAILVVFTHDVPWAPRPAAADPAPWTPPVRTQAPPAWPDVPVSGNLADLGPALAKAVGTKLAVARSKIARCVADAGADASAAGPEAEVVLRLAPRSAALHVEAVEVSDAGTPSELLECARRVLDGDAIPAPGVVPGRRYRVRVGLP